MPEKPSTKPPQGPSERDQASKASFREDPAPDNRVARFFPPLGREDRVALVESLTEGSRWSMNFSVMLGCSVIIAALGLMQNSVAVIIGAMLVAPLMTPLIGTGLALVQGNFKLLKEAAWTMGVGAAASVLISCLVRLLIPAEELTLQVSLRGAPDILDLLIAFFAGLAAGYAMTRPKVSNALPGVAISVALVPPLAASGIALGSGNWIIASGALLLFSTNMVAIIFASALVFRLAGIKTPAKRQTAGVFMKRVFISLSMVLLLMVAPLLQQSLHQLHIGKDRPNALALPERLWYQLHDRIDSEEGVDLVAGVRTGANRPYDVVLVIAAEETIPPPLLRDVDQMIDEALGEDMKVRISVLQQILTHADPIDGAQEP